MTRWFLRYGLQDNFIHNWLVAGPQLLPTDSLELNGQDGSTQISGIDETPCERAKFTVADLSGDATELTWRYLGCDDDHLVDLTDPVSPRRSGRAWAYTEVMAPADQQIRLWLYSFGPVQLWLNRQPAAGNVTDGGQWPRRLDAEVTLVKGANGILVRLEQEQGGALPLAFALQLPGAAQLGLKVRIPTQNRDTKLHQAVERLAARAYLERDLYAGPEALHVKWPGTIRAKRRLLLRLEKPSGAIAGEAQPEAGAGLSQHLFEGNWGKDGRYQVRIHPEFEQFVRGLRVSRDLDVNILHGSYVAEPEGDQSNRNEELLKHAAWWTDGIYAVISRMHLGLWKQVDARAIERIIQQVSARQTGDHETLMGLLYMAYRYAAHPSFPASLSPQLEECLLGFDYESGEDGEQGLDDDTAILRHACRILAGQHYPEGRFVASGLAGERQRERGEQAALAWFKRRGLGGFAAWDSGEGLAAMLLGLIALVDHAESEILSDLAAATADKLLFSLAVNSWQGVFGSTHGATSAASITDGRMNPGAAVSRLLWGVGCWNQHVAAPYALATSQQYGCPPIHEMIALDRSADLWSRERHVTVWNHRADGPAPDQEVNKVTYRTPDSMLCSAQDYRAGQAGSFEHIWQATLGPSAVVFVNHPRYMNQKDIYPANFWRGNGVLPRVAQWRDLLIALHQLPEDDWLGYTHAHFPLAAFDEHVLRRGWAFARKGDAYVALTASAGIKLIKDGPGAFRELRSSGRQNVWLCQMGRAEQDGSFAEFQGAILALPVRFEGLGVSLTSLRGDTIDFAWTGPLRVQGAPQPLDGFPHYDSPHCTCALGTAEMEIRFDEYLLRLNLATDDGQDG